MLLFRSLFFLFILFFHCTLFSQENRPTTAGKVFFNYVDQYVTNIDEVMGSAWFNDIFDHTRSWTVDDATIFLSSLEASEFPIPFILRILRNTNSLQRLQRYLESSKFQTGSDVFIDYVESYFREKLRQSDPSLEGEAFKEALEDMMLRGMVSRRNKPLWEERIRESAQDWSVWDAALFLDDLENEWDMDIHTIIKRLNATSFFETTYFSFTSRLGVYVEYLGKGSVKKILDKTFMPFKQVSVENIRAMLDAVFTYFDFEQEIMVGILSNNLNVIDNSLDIFQRKLDWLEDFLGRGDRVRGKEEIKEIVREKKSLNIINSVGIKFNKKTGEYENETEFRINFLRHRGVYDKEEVIELFKSNPKAFSEGYLDPDKITYLEELLGVKDASGKRRDGKTELDWVLKNRSFLGVVNFRGSKTQENLYVKFLRDRGFEPFQIADLFKSNPEAFSKGDLDPDKIAYLKELLGVEDADGEMRDGKAQLDWVLENRGFQGVVNFRGSKTQENLYVKFLRDRGFEPFQIADLFKSNPRAFSDSAGDLDPLDPNKIVYLEELLGVKDASGKKRDGKTELDWVLKNRSFQGVVDFKGTKRQENPYMQFLKARKFKPFQIADIFKSNPLAFSKGDVDPDKIAYLEELLGIEDADGNKRDGKAELNWVLQYGSFYGVVRFKGSKRQENKYVKFLRDRGFEPFQIADIFKSNPQAFSTGDLDPDKITYLENYLGKGNRKRGKQKLDQIILQKGGFRALVLFDYNSDTTPANRIIDVLENGLHFDQDQVIQIMENHFSELFVKELTEETSEEFLKRVTEKVFDICQKNLIK